MALIKFLDLQKLNHRHQYGFEQKLKRVLEAGRYILGGELQEFERTFAQYCNASHCIGVGNGLDALKLIFAAYIELGKLQKGDEVIVPANTYIASILAIIQADLVPVLVEPCIKTYNIDSKLISEKLGPKTKALLAVHLYGQSAHMDELAQIAQQHQLLLVEDAAQSAVVQSVKSQHLPKVQAYSFYPSKNLGALGDGGAVITDDPDLAVVIRSLRNYGSPRKYQNEFIGVNSRLDELQAAFLLEKLPQLSADNQRRRLLAKKYISQINNPKIQLPYWDFSDNHVFHLFVIRTPNRAELQQYLREQQIETEVHYPIPPHKQMALRAWNQHSFPITEKIHSEVLSLPISPVMSEEEVDYVISVLNKY